MSPRSNQTVASELGIHFTTVSRLRSGQRTPSLTLMQKISKTYDVPMDRLVQAKLRGQFSAVFGRVVDRPKSRAKTNTDT